MKWVLGIIVVSVVLAAVLLLLRPEKEGLVEPEEETLELPEDIAPPETQITDINLPEVPEVLELPESI